MGLLTTVPTAYPAEQKPPAEVLGRGEYVFRAAGCFGCHTDAKHGGRELAGGRALTTPFGTFYTPNITPDTETGIGKWSEQEFTRALRTGLGKNLEPLYPVFPYTSYTQMTAADLHALWVYLRSRPAVRQANKPHALKWFVSARSTIKLWRVMYFAPRGFTSNPQKSVAWNRGAYLVEAVTHCSECHTPRNVLGGIRNRLRFAGTRAGPENSIVPNITPDRNTGIGKWSIEDLIAYLENGMTPGGDFAGGLMAEVIDNSLQYLSKEDRAAIAEYIQSLSAITHTVEQTEKGTAHKEDWE